MANLGEQLYHVLQEVKCLQRRVEECCTTYETSVDYDLTTGVLTIDFADGSTRTTEIIGNTYVGGRNITINSTDAANVPINAAHPTTATFLRKLHFTADETFVFGNPNYLVKLEDKGNADSASQTVTLSAGEEKAFDKSFYTNFQEDLTYEPGDYTCFLPIAVVLNSSGEFTVKLEIYLVEPNDTPIDIGADYGPVGSLGVPTVMTLTSHSYTVKNKDRIIPLEGNLPNKFYNVPDKRLKYVIRIGRVGGEGVAPATMTFGSDQEDAFMQWPVPAVSQDAFSIFLSSSLHLGNVADIFPTPAALAEAFDNVFDYSFISFAIIGNDIFATIDPFITYTVADSAFRDTKLTFIREYGKQLTGIGVDSFLGCTDATEVILPGATELSADTFKITTISRIHLDGLETATKGGELSEMFQASEGSFAKLKTIGSRTFESFKATLIDLPSLEKVENTSPTDNLLTFGSMEDNTVLNIPNCRVLGVPSFNHNIFEFCNATHTINIHFSTAVNNNGQPDADLLYAIANGTTVNYVGQSQDTAPSLLSVIPNSGVVDTTHDIIIACAGLTPDTTVQFSGNTVVNSVVAELNNFSTLQLRVNVTHGSDVESLDITLNNGEETIFSSAFSVTATTPGTPYNDNYLVEEDLEAPMVDFDPTDTTLEATDVDGAIRELNLNQASGIENGKFRFNNNTDEANPGSGKVSVDNADATLVTKVFMSTITDEGVDIKFYIQSLGIGDRMLIQQLDDSTKASTYQVEGLPVFVDEGDGWWNIPVSLLETTGDLPEDNKKLIVVLRYFNLQGGDADTLQGEPKSYFLSKEEFEMTERANLIIGGVGGTINTPALLAEKFSFVESDVSEFKVIVNTVYAVIDVEYTTINVGGGLGSFTNNTEITSIYDGGNLKELNHSTFENASNLTSVELLGADVPVLAGVNKETFQEIGLLTKFNLPSLTYFDTNFIKNQTHPIGVDLDLSGVTSFASLGSFTTYKKVNLSSVTTIDRNGALGYSFYEELDIRNCTSFGDPTTDQSVFESITSGSHIIANYIHETSNNGGVDATLAYAIGSGATVEYIGQPEGLLAPSDIQLTPNYGLPSTTQDVVIDCIDMTSESIVKFSGDITVNSQSVELNKFGSLQIRANITHGVTEGAIDVTVWNGYETVFSGAYSILDTGTPEQYNDNYMTADDVPSTDTLYHYYIDNTNGDDATGVIGRIDKPFQTIDAVYSELPILNIDESYIQLNLMRGGSYPVNGKQPFNNFIFKSEHNVNLDYSNNANTALQVSTTPTSVVFDIPNGEITFNPNVDQLYTASFDIYCRKITTGKNTNATSAQFSTIKTAKIAVVVLTNQLFYQAGQGANVWVKSIETKMTQGRLFCTESSGGKDANIYIGRVYGTGEFVAAGTSGYVSIGNVSCDGDLIIQDVINSRTTLYFRNSLITNAWTMTDWNMGHLVLTGSIRDGSGNFTGGNPSNTNSSVTFKDFYCDFGSGIFNVKLLDFVTIINSVIKCDGIPFKVTQASTINFYGNSIIKSSSPSSFRTGGFATTLNIEGELQTNIDLSNDIQVTVVETPLFAYGGKKNRKEITASYTVNPKEDKYTIWLNSPTPITITVDDTLPESFECEFYNIGAGLVTFVGGTGTLNAPDGSTLATDKVATIMKVMNTNDYRLKGDLA